MRSQGWGASDIDPVLIPYANGEQSAAQTLAALDRLTGSRSRRPPEGLNAEQALDDLTFASEYYRQTGDTLSPEVANEASVADWERFSREFDSAGESLERQLLWAVGVGQRDGLLAADVDAPSQRHLADVREALRDASEISAATAAAPGGDGDARASRESALRAAQTLTPGRGSVTRSGSSARRQDQAQAAVIAAHERLRTDRVEDRTTELDQKSRDEHRDYPTMAHRTQQRDPQLR